MTNPSTYAFGDLNPLQRDVIRSRLQTYAAKQYPVDVFGAMKQATVDHFTPRVALAGPFKAICLRVEPDLSNPAPDSWVSRFFDGYTDQGQSVAGLVRVKARIPELHAMLPEPPVYGNTPGPHQKIIDMYPTFTAQTSGIQKPKEGDLIWVTYGNIKNLQDPIYLTPVFPAPMPGAAGLLPQPQPCGSSLCAETGMGAGAGMTVALGNNSVGISAITANVDLQDLGLNGSVLALAENIFAAISVFEGDVASIGADYEWAGELDNPRYDDNGKLAFSYEAGLVSGIYIQNSNKRRLVHPALRFRLAKLLGVQYNPYPASRYNGPDVPGSDAVEVSMRGNHVGLSYGFIQFTARSRSLGRVLQFFKQLDPDSFFQIFGEQAEELLASTNVAGVPQQFVLGKLKRDQIPDKGDTHSTIWGYEHRVPSCMPVGGVDLWTGHWVDRFKRAGQTSAAMRKAQTMAAAEGYLLPAIQFAKETGITSELGLALLTDRAVNAGPGGMKSFYGSLQGIAGSDQERFKKVLLPGGVPASNAKDRMIKLVVFDQKESNEEWEDILKAKPWLKSIALSWQPSQVLIAGGLAPAVSSLPTSSGYSNDNGAGQYQGLITTSAGSGVNAGGCSGAASCQQSLGCGVSAILASGQVGTMAEVIPGIPNIPADLDSTKFKFGLPASLAQGLPQGGAGRSGIVAVYGDPSPWYPTGNGREINVNSTFNQVYGTTKPLFWDKRYSCHKLMIPYLELFFDQVQQAGLIGEEGNAADLPKIVHFGVLCQRLTTGSTTPSLHTWGIAFDINSNWIHMGEDQRWNPAVLDRRIIDIAVNNCGFGWLGDFDAMHFELTKRPYTSSFPG
jgi:hypothetical protein